MTDGRRPSDPAPPDVSAERSLPPPRPARRRLGRYQLLFEIGSGGMATVFLARVEGPAGFEKLVALKRIHPHLARERRYVDMFLDEARIASRISHANVCSVFDVGEADGEYYLAMDYLVGETLTHVIRRVATRAEERAAPEYPAIMAKVMADACEGLHAAHELRGPDGALLQVVHRDVSPHNLFVTYDGMVRVMDFGIARAADRLEETATGEIKGKVAYLSPEQARGEPVDRRADVWALGVVLWEALALRRLFHRHSHVQTVAAVVGEPIPPPSAVRRGLPAELDRIVLRALERDPAARYATARDMGRDLVRVVARADEPLGPADLAAWMEHLFPDRVDVRRRLVDMARATEPAELDVLGEAPTRLDTPAMRSRPPVPTAALVREGSGPSLEPAAPTPAGLAPPREDATGSVERLISDTRRRRGRAVLVAGLVAALVAGALALALVARPPAPAPEPAPRSGSPPAVGPVRPEVAQAAVPAAAPAEELPPVRTEPAERPPAPPSLSIADAGPFRAPDTARDERARGGGRPGRRSEPDVTGAPGSVNVVTRGGWAHVLDARGRLLGTTPVRLELPAGRRSLELRPFGREPGRRITVDVEAGTSTRVVEQL